MPGLAIVRAEGRPQVSANPDLRYRMAALASVGAAVALWLAASFADLLDPNKLPPVQALAEAVSDLVQNGYSGRSFWATSQRPCTFCWAERSWWRGAASFDGAP